MHTETLDLNEPATLFLQLAQPCDKPCYRWATDLKGKGRLVFMRTLKFPHIAQGKSKSYWSWRNTRCSKRGKVVSHIAIKVWENPEQRKKWLTYHKATSRLISTT
ncbi:hypothetical protein EBZ80_19155 [bacterium]|nr:hypothetical protein [bacterium]